MYGERLRLLRLEKHLTQRQLADELNMSFSNIAQIEQETRGVTSENLKRFAEFYNVSTDWILGLSDDRNSKVDITNPEIVKLMQNTNDLTEEQLKEINSFVNYIKSKEVK